ncbi:nucleoside hydrolase [Leucobacter luti]|uniref:Purine nucleosidase/pyrimidine-specific ribonucleoside hydrolase n=1 Tax=Leucobacter luti TaxID=340320 RepID=A0A4Q7U8Q5_9MICO|nr:nucleoside hydrolase [Leucobacter luti]MBL3700474.1 nucleoside hydrolase [Leucobacter luti]RZT68692.1 purine nucleosidase/pyrimidine-specific ribonucleoside hydrolase [Leucobacter luti]
MTARPVIIDCDPGHDDAIAILLAVASPSIDLLAVTTCFGNCAVEDATRNALQILDLAGASHIPVAAGAAGPLSGETTLGNYVHGGSGLDGPELPEPSRDALPESAGELLARLLEAAEHPVTLVVIGPMTNIGALVRSRPDLIDRIAEIVFMGGSTERGNHTPAAEFNTFADPEALDIVLHSGIAVRMVGLNLTHQALATPEVVARMRAQQHTIGQTAAAWMGFFGSSYHRVWDFEAPPVHDPCTIAALIEPELITWVDAFVAVELRGEWTRGATLVDLHRRYPEHAPNARVAIALDAARYWDLVLGALDDLGRRS